MSTTCSCICVRELGTSSAPAWAVTSACLVHSSAPAWAVTSACLVCTINAPRVGSYICVFGVHNQCTQSGQLHLRVWCAQSMHPEWARKKNLRARLTWPVCTWFDRFFVWECLRANLAGRVSVIIPDELIFDPPRLLAYMHTHRVTRILITPSLMLSILEYVLLASPAITA